MPRTTMRTGILRPGADVLVIVPSRMSDEPDFGPLLEDLDDDDARESRLRLLRDLHDDGVTYEELEQAVQEQRLAVLPVERVLRREGRYTDRELAEKAGV